jgi:hypothetical protein
VLRQIGDRLAALDLDALLGQQSGEYPLGVCRESARSAG